MFEEQPIGWRLHIQQYAQGTHDFATVRKVHDPLTFAKRDDAEREQRLLPEGAVSCITPVYITRAKRGAAYRRAQLGAFADLPLMKKRLTE